MIPEFFDKKTHEKIAEELKENFGIERIPEKIMISGKEKMRAFTGNLTKEELRKLSEITFIESIGLYIMNWQNDEIRLTIDGATFFKDQIKKGIFEMNDKQFEEWMHGKDLEIKNEERGFRVMKYKKDFFGMGKLSAEKISNFVPKSRRIRTMEI